MHGQFPIWMVGFAPDYFTPHSGMWPVAEVLQARRASFSPVWERWSRRSWRLGNLLRQWGIRHFGSAWNAWVPIVSEWILLRKMPRRKQPYPVHFLWGEFAAPRRIAAYHRKGAKVVVSVHCSARRWNQVWLRPDGYARADRVVLTSESQRPFVARHVPPERIRTIRHGVVADFFTPPANRPPRPNRFRLLLLGDTERDHELAAQIAAQLPADRFEWRIRTLAPEKSCYEGLPAVTLLPRLNDEELREEYRQADLLVMPMLDSAANNVMLESMACGTPVMVNRVGGVPEYVSPDCNILMNNDRHPAEWVAQLHELERQRNRTENLRPATRAWAEKFDWKSVAEDYRALYRDLLAEG